MPSVPKCTCVSRAILTPTTLYADGGDGQPLAIKSLPARFDAAPLTTEQFFAISSDGTRVPYFVTRPQARRRPAPTVLYGYGGFEISQTPSYSANFGMLWLSRGGVFVVANIRGGGEYGPAWHQAALLRTARKPTTTFRRSRRTSSAAALPRRRSLASWADRTAGCW